MSLQSHSSRKAFTESKTSRYGIRPVNASALQEPSKTQLGPEMQWLRNELLEGAASKPGKPFSEEYFQKLLDRRKIKQEV
jgi:hypothetical protein